jgi:ADP-ribose pyrophosphatase YjhB (NUDIX family)
MKYKIPECFYRISIKALILDESKRFLLIKEDDGIWELPGGGLEFGETPHEGINRELHEETGLVTTYIADSPSYFTTWKEDGSWRANLIYETKVRDLNFTEISECVEMRFFTVDEVIANKDIMFFSVIEFVKLYNP